jgi:hypothetical protein
MMRCLPMIVLLALAAGGAAAQTIYKSVMPDGRISYGNAPVKGAVKVEPITVEAVPSSDSPASANRDSASAASRVREDLRSEDAQWAKASQEIRSAQDALNAAKLAQQSGVEPLPGEMIGNAGGGVRPSEAYLARQKQLAEQVRQAQARVDEAFTARNALR